MRNWRAVVAAIIAWLILGVGIPTVLLFWLLSQTEHPYVVDAARLSAPQRAFADHPTLTTLSGAFAGMPGATAVYPDASFVSIVRSGGTTDILETYESGLHASRSSATQFGNYRQSDLVISGGRVARTFLLGDTIIVFVAPNPARLDALIAATPALQHNPQRGLGNEVFDRYLLPIIIGALVWVLGTFAIASLVIFRNAKPPSISPPPGTPAVDAAELARRLLALGDGTHPFTVNAGAHPGEYFVDWRYDATFNAFIAAYGDRKLFRIRLRLKNDEHIVDSTDFQSERTVSAGAFPGAFANMSWTASRGYVFFEREIGNVNGKPYRFDVREMRAPVVTTITQAGWTYRPQL